MARHPQSVDITQITEVTPVLDAMRACTEAGRGWVNIRPDLELDAAGTSPGGLSHLFRRNRPDAALGTWMRPDPKTANAPQQIGVQHNVGTQVIPVLRDRGLDLGDGWKRTQDSPRRGLLVDIPADESHAEVLHWILEVTRTLTRVPTTGTWTADIYFSRDT